MPAPAQEQPVDRDRGFALVAVTIAVAMLSMMIAAVSDAARRHVNEARGGVERLRMDAAIDGALTTVAATMATEDLTADWLDHPQNIVVGGVSVTVSVRPEVSKVDLNAAPLDLLENLFTAVGVSSERATRLSAAISDWRDPDAFASADGAEAAEYISTGRKYVPANADFDSVSELGLVMGADDALVRCLAGDVTVFTNQSNVDAQYASKHVRHALGLVGAPAASDTQSGVEVHPGATFDLVAHATNRDGAVVSREVVLRFTGNPRDPVWTLASRARAPDPGESELACKTFAAANTASGVR